MSKYYYLDGQNQIGPVTKEELQGKITKETLVWREGMANWGKAGEIEDLVNLFPNIPTPPPIPGEKTVTPPPFPQNGRETLHQTNTTTTTNKKTFNMQLFAIVSTLGGYVFGLLFSVVNYSARPFFFILILLSILTAFILGFIYKIEKTPNGVFNRNIFILSIICGLFPTIAVCIIDSWILYNSFPFLFTAFLICLIAGFICGKIWKTSSDKIWFKQHSKHNTIEYKENNCKKTPHKRGKWFLFPIIIIIAIIIGIFAFNKINEHQSPEDHLELITYDARPTLKKCIIEGSIVNHANINYHNVKIRTVFYDEYGQIVYDDEGTLKETFWAKETKNFSLKIGRPNILKGLSVSKAELKIIGAEVVY